MNSDMSVSVGPTPKLEHKFSSSLDHGHVSLMDESSARGAHEH